MKRAKIAILLLIIIVSVSTTAVSLYNRHENNLLIDLKDEMIHRLPDGSGEEEMAVDFSYLHELNPDIVAWIDIPETGVSYPVLQSGEDKDDDYYLHHNVDGTYGYPASIYMQKANDADFFDSVTVLYGHNMKNGSMFAGLHNYDDKDYFDAHSDIYVYTPTGTKHYRVFAALTFDDRLILDAYNEFQTGGEIQAFYKESVEKANNVNYGVEVNEDSKILVLSTCEKGQNDVRYLVEAVLVD
jgi:sortase B